MNYAGGYAAYRALLEDAGAYDDVLAAMAGEADAARVIEMERRAREAQANRGL